MIVPKLSTEPEDDWETDPDYINDVTEESQRWGGARDTGQSFSELDKRNFIYLIQITYLLCQYIRDRTFKYSGVCNN